MACPFSFLSCQYLDPDKPGYTTSCQGDETGSKCFARFFLDFLSPTFVTDPRVIESVVVSAPAEHPHLVHCRCFSKYKHIVTVTVNNEMAVLYTGSIR